ncbi:MAG: hypothetical protein J6S63_10590 [Atopobiaceae bacterium]|nr:hypothetical protein [Atopobiaceae bacterium]
MSASIAQLNVRMDRELKERGDATLRLAGSSPVKIIRQLWERLALGGDAYKRIMEVLSPTQGAAAVDDPQQLVAHSASLFQELGAFLGEDLPAFEADLRPISEILEEAEWELLDQKELA